MSKNFLNIGVGIIGIKMIATRKDGGSKTIEITTTGSMNTYNIPAVIVFCEDRLTKDIITYSLHSAEGITHCSFKFIISGSWKNIITSLAGCLLYSDELEDTGNTKVLSTVGVIDGDITDTEIDNVISECYMGDYLPDNLENIKKRIKEYITNFSLPDNIIDRKNTTGKPELNIKKMLEEINEESIDSVLGERKKELKSWLEKAKDNESKQNIKNEIYFLDKEFEDTLEIIKISKSISRETFKNKDKNGKYKLNYHCYFKMFARKLEGRYLVSYGAGTTPLLLLIYRLVNKFNKKRWDEYVGPVVEFLTQISEGQRERFSHNTYNNDIID